MQSVSSTVADSPSDAPQRLWAPKVYYFCYFGAGASLMPFLALYYRANGMPGPAIGVLTGVAPLVTLFAAPLWGAVADASRRYKTTLMAAISATLIAVFLLAQAHTFAWLLPAVVLYAFFGAPLIPLVDNSVVALLGERRQSYGRLRLWGAVGWGIAGATSGFVIQRTGIRASFVLYLCLMACGLAVASQLPMRKAQSSQPFWSGLRVMVGAGQWAIFLAAVYIASIAAGMINNFLFLYLQDLHASASLMGFSLTVATVSEVPVFFFSDRLLRRWNARGLLLISMGATALRLAAYALMPAAWYVLPIHLLHGLTFSALWVAGVSYAGELAPPGMGATAQGLFTATYMGLGAASGALLGGLLYSRFGGSGMYMAGAIGVAVGVLFFAFQSPGARKPYSA